MSGAETAERRLVDERQAAQDLREQVELLQAQVEEGDSQRAAQAVQLQELAVVRGKLEVHIAAIVAICTWYLYVPVPMYMRWLQYTMLTVTFTMGELS